MNVQLASLGTPTAVETAGLAADDRRKKLIITSQTGDVYLNFSGTAASASVFDIKLAAGTSYTIDNYTGPCTANNANVRYVSFK
jgi:hypothetical protein